MSKQLCFMHFVRNVKKKVHFSPGGANNIIQKLEGVFFLTSVFL